MNPKYHLLAAVAALSFGACSTDDTSTGPETGGYKISFTIAEDPEPRTTLDKGDILRWVPTDKVGIYTVGKNVNPNTLTVADVNQHPVEFIGVLNKLVSPGDMFFAYYPYDAEQSTNPKAVKLSIPAEQIQSKAGVYNGKSHSLVALPMAFTWEKDSYAARISSVRFRQLGAIVELQLCSSDETLRSEKIQSVTFKSDNPLAGDFTFDLTSVTDKEELPISGYELKEVTTTLAEPAVIPSESGEAACVYLTIAPGTYAGQFVVTTDVAQYTFNLKNSMTFERAVIKGLPADLAGVERIALSPDDFILENNPIHFEDTSVKKICVANWDTNKDGELSYKEAAAVTDLKDVFKQKGNITSFNELQYFTGLQSIRESAFSYCSSLTSIHIPDGVTTIEEVAFYECSSLTSITIPDGVTSIENGTFNGCSSLTNITIPDGVTSIEAEAFRDCSSLTNITIPDGVTWIRDSAFQGCSSLTSITIPEGVTWIRDSAFQGCSSLTSINIPERVTSIGDNAFNGCSSLTSIHIPDGVTKIGVGAFSGCSRLKSIDIPDGVTAIEDRTFNGCSRLTSINIPDGVTLIRSEAFSDCSRLTSIHIPEGVTSIGDNAFKGCSSLTSIHIPEGVTSIGDNAFKGCSSLTSIDIPDGVTTIGYYAFNYCSNLTSVYCKSTTPPCLCSGAFSSTPWSMKIYVPTASVEAYKTSEFEWHYYASQIFAYNN